MKKTAITILLMLSAVCGYSQSAYDGFIFSENNYEGTARSVAMGNAFTALGGDLGAVNINPAGSAVAGYSQITVTPALSFTASTAQGVSPFENGTLPYFERKLKSRMSRLNMPNIGMTFCWDTHRKTGLKNVTVGFIVNQTASFDQDVYAAGMNSTTSFMGSLAYNTDGYSTDVLNGPKAYENAPWTSVVGYQSGMISAFGGYDDRYVGASEKIFPNGEIVIGGALDQKYGRRVGGSKYDYIFNVGANISDFLYIGANLGMTSLNYEYDDYFKESAIDPDDFEIVLDNGSRMAFNDMTYRYSYQAVGSGYFAKFGVILTPIQGLRIGAAIQTPTINTITEYWSEMGETTFSTAKYKASSPEGMGEYSYTFVAPYRANFGLAYTFGKYGVISADYEICDYSTMKFRTNGYDDPYFDELNAEIRHRFKVAQAFRLGGEAKLGPLAARVGYGYNNSNGITQNISFGLGYSSKGSFFMDVAARKSIMAREYYMPYSDYIFDDEGYILEPTPELLIHTSRWKVLLTLGWRF